MKCPDNLSLVFPPESSATVLHRITVRGVCSFCDRCCLSLISSQSVACTVYVSPRLYAYRRGNFFRSVRFTRCAAEHKDIVERFPSHPELSFIGLACSTSPHQRVGSKAGQELFTYF